MSGIRLVACLAVVAATLASTPAVNASFPGANGRIAFNTDRDGNLEIYTITTQGSNPVRLTNNPAPDSLPAWSSDGSKIAFTSDRDGNEEIYTMKSDGSAQTRLTSNSASDSEPSWSPDGTKIAFRTNRDGNAEIYTMNADGTGQTRLTSNVAVDADPAWSPDGTKITFRTNRDGNNEVYAMEVDGTAQTNLTSNAAFDADPSWSPDGTKIVFHTNRDGSFEIYTMSANGAGLNRLTNDPGSDASAVWSPDGTKIAFASTRDGNVELYTMSATGGLPTNRSNNPAFDSGASWQPTYQIPESAPSIEVSLVPNLRQTISANSCIASGRTPTVHGPPDLPGGTNPDTSCSPATYLPGTAAVLGIQAVGSAQLTVIPGDANTAANEQDYRVTVDASDVRFRFNTLDYNPNPGGADLTLIAKLRISDTLNGATAAEPATVSDVDLAVPVNCDTTADFNLGAACSVTTTANSVTPGLIKEGNNAVVDVFRIRLRDAGNDGFRGNTDDRDFAMQGIYGP